MLAIADELSENGFILRYKVQETDDGLEGPEGTFLICSFWLVSALSEIGEKERAAGLCETPPARTPRRSVYTPRSSTPTTGRHLGNFPQAFTHLALIEAAGRIILAEIRRGVIS